MPRPVATQAIPRLHRDGVHRRLPALAVLALLIALALPVAAPPHACAQDKAQSINMGLCPYYPPFYRMQPDGTWHGLFSQFLDAFQQAHPQYRINRVDMPRKRMDHALLQGKLDAFALNSPMFVPMRDREHYSFSRPLWRSCDYVAVRANDPFRYSGLESLEGRTLGLIHGNGYGPLDSMLANGKIKEERVRGGPRLVKMLLAGHVDVAVINEHSETTAMERMRIAPDTIRILEPPVYCFDLCVQVRNEHGQFLADLNAFIQANADWLNDSLHRPSAP